MLPEGLLIVNRPGDRASYEVQLPRGVTTVRVRIAEAPERRLIPAAGVRRWTIDLNQPEL